MSLTVGSLFAGIGGFDLALERVGFRVSFQVELDPFCRRVLARRFPHATRWVDARKFWGNGDETLDLLVGGFPCQDLSVAGKRAGLAGERSGLFSEIVRIAKDLKPTYGLFENVPGLFSSDAGRDMWAVLQGLRECWPAVGYAVLDSQYFGVPQRRRRVFFVCGPRADRIEEILFKSEGGGVDSAAGGEEGTHVAASLRSRSAGAGVSVPGRGGEDDVNIVVSNCLQERGGKGPDSDCSQAMVIQALTNLGSGGPDDNEAQGGHLIVAPQVAACLNPGHEAKHTYAGDGGTMNIVAVRSNQRGEIRERAVHGSLNATKSAKQFDGVLHRGVRRLTPTECERLQGFPDGWTCLCDQSPCKCPDGPRYKALGNAVTVNVIEYLGRRIMAAHFNQEGPR